MRGRAEPILTTVEKAWHSVYSVVLFLRRYMLNNGLEEENNALYYNIFTIFTKASQLRNSVEQMLLEVPVIIC